MLDDRRIAEILISHPAVAQVTLRKARETSTVQTDASANLEPLLEQLGLVVVKTKRRRKNQADNRQKLWPYWYQVRKAPPGSRVLDHDTIVALVCAKVITLKQNDLPVSIMNATTDDVDVMSIWGNRYVLRKIGKGLYLLRAELPFANIVGRVFVPSPDPPARMGEDDTLARMKLDVIGPTPPPGPEIACTQAAPGRESTDEN